jgi:DNA replication protein DnaC
VAKDTKPAVVVEAVAGETTTVDQAPRFYACACPCGCKIESTMPDMGSTALARHARCATCGTDAHLSANPASVDPGAAATSRLTTEMYVPTPDEVKIAEEAHREVYTEIWTQQFERWRNSLPEKFQDADTEHAQVKERLRRLAIGETGIASMLILGAPGYGKTWLAVAYANAAIKAGYFKPSEVMFGSEAELLASTANSSFGEVEKGLRRLISPKIRMLIIDDVGRGTWLNEAMRPKVFSLVLDKFWSENRVVVFTSNLNPQALGEYVGDGAMDRLRSLVGNSSLILDSESKRRKVTDEMLARAGKPAAPVVPPVG